MGLEEDHHVADRALLLPCGHERIGTRAAEAVHLTKTVGLLVEDLQGIEAEFLDDALRGDLADALDEAGAEILLDPCERRRHELGHARRAQLLTVVAIDLDLSTRADARTDRDLREHAHHGESVAPTRHEHLHDTEAVLTIFERDPLDLAFDRDLCGLRDRHAATLATKRQRRDGGSALFAGKPPFAPRSP